MAALRRSIVPSAPRQAVMIGVLFRGLLHSKRHGLTNIGWEIASILGLYVMSAAALFA